jgi:hypothetical protein
MDQPLSLPPSPHPPASRPPSPAASGLTGPAEHEPHPAPHTPGPHAALPQHAAHPHPHTHPTSGAFLRWRRHHARPPGSPCFNCGAILQGPWCHACGQLGEDYHRSAHHLIWEAFEGLFHADGRLWHTLPRLLFRPAALTRDYLAGKRASQVPPFRIFLIVLLLVFFIGETLTGIDHASILKIDPNDAGHVNDIHVSLYKPWDDAITAWTRTHVSRAMAHPDAFIAAMAAWAHDFAFLSLPIFGFILAAIFIFRRRFVLFDHMIFSMHSLSVLGLLLLTAMVLNHFIGDQALLLLWLVPVHQFFHLRGVYGTSLIGTALRLGVLATAATVAFAFIMVALVLVGIAALQS